MRALSADAYNVGMRSNRLILGLISLTLVVTVLAVSAKLRATPKFHRIQAGMTRGQLREVLGPGHNWDGYVSPEPEWSDWDGWDYDEGLLMVCLKPDETGSKVVTDKKLLKRGPLERLAWLAGWGRWPNHHLTLPARPCNYEGDRK